MLYPSSLVFDQYGNKNGLPIVILEDIFYRNSRSSLSLDSFFFQDYSILHIKYMQWETFPFDKKSLIDDLLEKIAEIILPMERKPIFISQGYSSTLAMKTVLDYPDKIRALHLLSPYILLEGSDHSDHYKDFFLWWSGGSDPLRNFFALPNLSDFFGKYLRLMEICSEQDYEVELNFWLAEQFSIKDSLKLQAKFPGLEILRIDRTPPREMLHDPKVQKILSWKFQKYLQIEKTQELPKKK